MVVDGNYICTDRRSNRIDAYEAYISNKAYRNFVDRSLRSRQPIFAVGVGRRDKGFLQQYIRNHESETWNVLFAKITTPVMELFNDYLKGENR